MKGFISTPPLPPVTEKKRPHNGTKYLQEVHFPRLQNQK